MCNSPGAAPCISGPSAGQSIRCERAAQRNAEKPVGRVHRGLAPGLGDQKDVEPLRLAEMVAVVGMRQRQLRGRQERFRQLLNIRDEDLRHGGPMNHGTIHSALERHVAHDAANLLAALGTPGAPLREVWPTAVERPSNHR
jgi:hypothetical protein